MSFMLLQFVAAKIAVLARRLYTRLVLLKGADRSPFPHATVNLPYLCIYFTCSSAGGGGGGRSAAGTGGAEVRRPPPEVYKIYVSRVAHLGQDLPQHLRPALLRV